MEPPSKALLKTLLDLKLCTLSDLKRCRHQVRRLARDLPTFDSVWIDALLQSRRITPFQARLLDSPHPDRLAIGPCVLLDQLGHGHSSSTFLARRRDGRQFCVLKQIAPSPESAAATLESLAALVARLQRFAHPSLVVPHACLRHGSRLVAVSRYVPGPHLGELLVRRGRFPAPVVWAIARQLVDGLAALEEQGGVHGDIRPATVRLTDAGCAVLVDAGITPATTPELTIHADLPPDRYDGVAPERIGTGGRADSRSDLYALGCLLWQLLSGRPPFPTGDPLAKLVAHQLRTVEDVRTVAPDTPELLATLIASLTARHPEQRPRSFAEVRSQIGAARRSGRRRLAKFRAMFKTAVRRAARPARAAGGPKWSAIVLLLVVLSGASLTLLDRGARNYAANILGEAAHGVRQHTTWLAGTPPENDSATTNGPATGGTLLPFPAPDAQGVVTLDQPGPYGCAKLSAVGPLTIRAAEGLRPVIRVGGEPCQLLAERVFLEGLRFEPESATAPRALLLIQAQHVAVQRCRFAAAPAAPNAVALGWRAVDPSDRTGCTLTISNTRFEQGTALFCSTPPRRLDCNNVLKLGAGPFLSLPNPPEAGSPSAVTLRNVTLRAADALLEYGWPARGLLMINAADCVLDVSGPHASLLRLAGEREPLDWTQRIEFQGEGSVARPDVIVAAWRNPASESNTPLDTAGLALGGLSALPFEFAGPPDGPAAGSVIRASASTSASRPGIDAARLPEN